MATFQDILNPSARPASEINGGRSAPPASRRSFLAGLSAALAAPAAVAAVPAVAAAAAPAIQENPALLEIGQQLPALLDAYRDAAARRSEAAETYERTRPALPGELIWSREAELTSDLCWPELGLDNNGVYLGEGGFQRYVYRWKQIQSHIILREIPRNPKQGRRLHKIARLAKKYERDTAAALKASGYEDRDREVNLPAIGIDKLAWRLHQESDLRPRTATGVLVFANVMLAIEECAGPDDIRGRGHVAGLGLIIAEAPQVLQPAGGPT